MNKPVKCGDLYVMFDDSNISLKEGSVKNPLYAFLCNGRKIIEFYNLTDKLPREIVIPDIAGEDRVENPDFSSEYFAAFKLEDYMTGNIQLSSDLFKKFEELTLVLPFKASVQISQLCFKENAKVEIKMPEGMVLRGTGWQYDNGYDYEYEMNYLVCDASVPNSCGSRRSNFSTFDIEGFNFDYYNMPKINFKTSTLEDEEKLEK